MVVINKNSLARNILTILVLINFLIFFNKSVFDLYDTIAFYGNFLGLILVILIFNKINKKEVINFSFLLIIAIYTLLALYINNGGIGSVIITIYGLLTLVVFKNIPLNDKNYKIILFILIILNLFLTLNSKDYFIKYISNLDQYINSNTIGMVLFYTAIYIKILLKKFEFKYSNFFIFVFYILSIYGIVNTQSRGALISLIFFIIVDSFVPKKFWKSSPRLIIMFMLITLFGTFFPYFYISLYKSNIELNLAITSKSLYSGREAIWLNFFNIVFDNVNNFLFGLGSKAELWENHRLNLHNNYLAIFTNFGLVGFLLYYGFLFKEILNISKNKNLKNYHLSSLLGFLSVLFYGFIEVTTFWFIMFFFNFLFFGIINSGVGDKKYNFT